MLCIFLLQQSRNEKKKKPNRKQKTSETQLSELSISLSEAMSSLSRSSRRWGACTVSPTAPHVQGWLKKREMLWRCRGGIWHTGARQQHTNPWVQYSKGQWYLNKIILSSIKNHYSIKIITVSYQNMYGKSFTWHGFKEVTGFLGQRNLQPYISEHQFCCPDDASAGNCWHKAGSSPVCPAVPQPTATLPLISPFLCDQHEYGCLTSIMNLPYATQILFGAVSIVLGVFVIRCQLKWEIRGSSGFIPASKGGLLLTRVQ